MPIVVAQNQTETKSEVRQLSVTNQGSMAGFFNVSNAVEVELAELGAWLTKNQEALTWEAGQTAKGKLQYVCRAKTTILGWYQPGSTGAIPGSLTFSTRTKITSLDNLI